MSDIERNGRPVEELLRRHRPYIAKICNEILVDRHDADEAIQQTMVTLFQHFRTPGELDKIQDITAYIAKAAKNASLKYRESRHRKSVAEYREDDLSVLDRPAPDDPLETFLDTDFTRTLDEALAALPEPFEQAARSVIEYDVLGPLAPLTDKERKERSRGRPRIRASAHVVMRGRPGAQPSACPGLESAVQTAHEGRRAGRISRTHLNAVVTHLGTCPVCAKAEWDPLARTLRGAPFLLGPEIVDQIRDALELVSAETGTRPARVPRSRGPRPPRGPAHTGQALTAWTLVLLLGALLFAVRPQTLELASELVPALARDPYVGAAGPSGGNDSQQEGRTRRDDDAGGGEEGGDRTGRQDHASGRQATAGADRHGDGQDTTDTPRLTQPDQGTPPGQEAGPEAETDSEAEPEEEKGPKAPEAETAPEQDSASGQESGSEQGATSEQQQAQTPADQQQHPVVVQPVQPQPVPATPLHTLTVRLTGYGAHLKATADGKSLGICEQPGNTDHDCSWQVAEGAEVTLRAADDLAEWRQGPCGGQSKSCAFTMGGPRTVVMYLYVPG